MEKKIEKNLIPYFLLIVKFVFSRLPLFVRNNFGDFILGQKLSPEVLTIGEYPSHPERALFTLNWWEAVSIKRLISSKLSYKAQKSRNWTIEEIITLIIRSLKNDTQKSKYGMFHYVLYHFYVGLLARFSRSNRDFFVNI